MNNFAENLKRYRKFNKLNQTDLASRIGLKQTTIANYEKGYRTPTIDVLISIADELKIPIDTLIGHRKSQVAEGGKRPNNGHLIELIVDALVRKEAQEAYIIIDGLYNSGSSLEYIFEEVMTPVMVCIGQMWERDELTIGDEHAATEIMLRIIDALSIRNLGPVEGHKKVICMTLSHEQHTLGMKMIAALIELKGYRVIYVGNNLPTASLNELLRREGADCLLISVTMKYHMDSAKNLVSLIRSNKEFKDLKIAIGGQACTSENTKEMEIDEYCKTIQELDYWIEKNVKA